MAYPTSVTESFAPLYATSNPFSFNLILIKHIAQQQTQ